MLKIVNGITYYSSSKLGGISGLSHAFLCRTGGVSSGHLATLNMGRRDEDKPESLEENRKRVADAFRIKADRIFTVSQVHGDRIVIIGDTDAAPEDVREMEADAIISDINGISVGVLTADCVPILLFDCKKRVAAAVHAGWKGTALKITSKTVKMMEERFESSPQDIIAAIGPAIGLCCYEVGAQVVTAIGDTNRVSVPYKDRWRLDLPKANLIQLQGAGIIDIDVLNICTSCRTDLFFSHRGERGETGRQLSFISLKRTQ